MKGHMYLLRINKRIAVLTGLIMILVGLTFLYQGTFAEAGGLICTGQPTDGISSIFGNKATANITKIGNDKSLLINITDDVNLTESIVLKHTGDVPKVIINLNGHTITAADGKFDNDKTKGGKVEAHNGDNAIEIEGNLDLTINGGNESTVNKSGTIKGGNGILGGCRTDSNGNPIKGMGFCGGDGGAGIKYITNEGTELEKISANYNYISDGSGDMPVITIDNGAKVIGGNGGNNNTLAMYSVVDDFNSYDVEITAGAGGYGIGESNYVDEVLVENTYSFKGNPVFFALLVKDGTVSGGNGGDMDCTSNPTNNFTVGDNFQATETSQGVGGDGVYTANGRKYIEVYADGTIAGGIGGTVKQSTFNRLGVTVEKDGDRDFNRACVGGNGGNGIHILGDCGRTEAYSYDDGDQTVDDGIVIKGKVIGGNAKDVSGRYTYGGKGGSGIQIDDFTNKAGIGNFSDKRTHVAEYYQSYDLNCGDIIIEAGGIVSGGNGASAVWGNGGDGGAGVGTEYASFYEGGVIKSLTIEGTLKSGDGGDAKFGGFGPVYNYPAYGWQAGNGGYQGSLFSESRSFNSSVRTISGRGKCIVGNCGQYNQRLQSYVVSKFTRPIEKTANTYGGELPDPVYIKQLVNTFSGTITKGLNTRTANTLTSDGTTATITTNVDVNSVKPVAGNNITCKVNYGSLGQNYLANGGKVYVDWRYEDGTSYLDMGTSEYNTTKELEPNLWASGLDGLRYTFNTNDGLLKHTKTYGVYCYVALENGVTVRSNTIWFTINKIPAPPTDITTKVITQDGKKKIKVSWTGPAAGTWTNSYYVARRDSKGNLVRIGFNNASGSDLKNQKVYSSGTSHYLIDNYCTAGAEYIYYVCRNTYIKTGTNTYTSKDGPYSDGVLGVMTPTVAPTVAIVTGLALVNEKTSYTTLGLKWTAPVIGNNCTGYQIYRKLHSGDDSTYELVRSDVRTTYYVDSGLAKNTAYDYKVRAFYEAYGTKYYGSKSVCVSGTTLDYDIGSPSLLSRKICSYSKVELTWKAPADADGKSYQYEIYYKRGTTGSYKLLKSGIVGSTYTVRGLSPGYIYTFRVRAYVVLRSESSQEKVAGGFCKPLSVTMAKPLVVAPSIKASLYGYDDVKFAFISKGVKYPGYQIYYLVKYKRSTWKEWKLISSGTTENYAKKANLINGGKYYFKAQPYIKVNDKNYYGASKYTTIYTLKKISVKVEKYGTSKIRVYWGNIPGQTGYQIYRKSGANGKWTCVKTVASKYKAWIDSSKKKGTVYYYKVRAYKYSEGTDIYGPFSSVKYVKR